MNDLDLFLEEYLSMFATDFVVRSDNSAFRLVKYGQISQRKVSDAA